MNPLFTTLLTADKPVHAEPMSDKPVHADFMPDKPVHADFMPDKPVHADFMPDKPDPSVPEAGDPSVPEAGTSSAPSKAVAYGFPTIVVDGVRVIDQITIRKDESAARALLHANKLGEYFLYRLVHSSLSPDDSYIKILIPALVDTLHGIGANKPKYRNYQNIETACRDLRQCRDYVHAEASGKLACMVGSHAGTARALCAAALHAYLEEEPIAWDLLLAKVKSLCVD
jgi:hypothetical protein